MITHADLKFHHIGYATKDLKSSARDFEKLGYKCTGNFIDDVQSIKICIMKREGHPLIELIEPNGDDNPVNRFIVHHDTITYHIAYLTKFFYEDITNLRKAGFSPTTKILKAVAFNNRNFIFLFRKNVGLIELLDDSIS